MKHLQCNSIKKNYKNKKSHHYKQASKVFSLQCFFILGFVCSHAPTSNDSKESLTVKLHLQYREFVNVNKTIFRLEHGNQTM